MERGYVPNHMLGDSDVWYSLALYLFECEWSEFCLHKIAVACGLRSSCPATLQMEIHVRLITEGNPFPCKYPHVYTVRPTLQVCTGPLWGAECCVKINTN